MSQSRQEQVKCPSCGQPAVFTIWDSINATTDPELKERFMSGDLNAFRCEGCGDQTQIWYPVLYHDMQQLLLVWFMSGADKPPDVPGLLDSMDGDDGAGYRFRLVLSPNELKEKILLADAGLDDRVVELMKWLIRQNDHGARLKPDDVLLFAQVEEEEAVPEMLFVILRGGEQLSSSLPFSMYGELAEAVAPQLGTIYPGEGRWLRVHESQLGGPEE